MSPRNQVASCIRVCGGRLIRLGASMRNKNLEGLNGIDPDTR